MKHLTVDLPPLQPAAPSCTNAKTKAKPPDQQHFCIICVICSSDVFKVVLEKGELPVSFSTVKEKNMRKVQDEKHNALQLKNLDKLNAHMRKTKLNKKITKQQKLRNIRLEPESKAYEKLLYNKAKKIFFSTVHCLLKQEEYTGIEKFNIWAKYFFFFF